MLYFRDFILYQVKPENTKFYKTTQFAYYFGLSHFFAIFFFHWMEISEMMWFNALISTPSFAIALVINRMGRHNTAFAMAFFELFFHQVLATYFLGWGMGAHYYLIYLGGLCFFNPKWSRRVHIGLLILIIGAYILLYLYCQAGIYEFSKNFIDRIYLNNAVSSIIALGFLINGYSKGVHKAEQQLQENNVVLTNQKEEIELKRKKIAQSINYAQKIQNAVIPNHKILEKYFTDFFISFKPKDIVSGDFYWFTEVENKPIIVCADCTGHGVLGHL